jgi:hypothetical protein
MAESPERAPLCAELGEQPMDVCFHPSRPLVAAGLITGAVELFPFTPTAAGAVTAHEVHAESCRAVRFLLDGASLASGGADCALAVTCVETGRLLARVADAHGAPINRLTVLSETVLATGAPRARGRPGMARSRRSHGRPGMARSRVGLMQLCRPRCAQATTRGTCGCGTRARARAWPPFACTRTLWRTCTTLLRATRCSPPAATARSRCWTCAPPRCTRAPTTRRTSCCRVRARDACHVAFVQPWRSARLRGLR